MPRSVPWPESHLLAAVFLGASVFLTAPSARACGDEGQILLAGALLTLTPSEVGIETVTGRGPVQGAPVIGWAYQIPVPLDGLRASLHRLALSFEWAPGGPGADVRARAGYRYVGQRLELGLGVTTGPDHVRLSPELGVRLLRARDGGFGAHLRARVEASPTSPRDLRTLVTVGWTLL
jgi:hypothetical protein